MAHSSSFINTKRSMAIQGLTAVTMVRGEKMMAFLEAI